MESIKMHTITQSIILHLLPGILIGTLYFILAPIVVDFGYPTIMALIISAIFILIPFELGVLLLQKKKGNDPNYQNIILNREKVSIKSYFFWIITIIVLSGLAFALLEPISNFLRDNVFSFIPTSHHFDFRYSGAYSSNVLLNTYILGFIVLCIIAPIAEELYFRGYLLPRIPLKEEYSGILHSFLFAGYHVWTPWMIVTRTIGFYPFVFAVQKTKNINIVIIAHCIVNTIDFIVAFIFLANL